MLTKQEMENKLIELYNKKQKLEKTIDDIQNSYITLYSKLKPGDTVEHKEWTPVYRAKIITGRFNPVTRVIEYDINHMSNRPRFTVEEGKLRLRKAHKVLKGRNNG